MALGPHKEEQTGQEPRAQEKICLQTDPFGDPSTGSSAHRAGQARRTPSAPRLTDTSASCETIPGQGLETHLPNLPTHLGPQTHLGGAQRVS